jgi:hypothetical protein
MTLITTSCAVKKYIVSPAFYNSCSDLGLILVTNDITTRRSGASALGAALIDFHKYDAPLETVEPKLDPEKKFRRMYLSLFIAKGKI